jgi:hypothetical protein
VRIRLNFTLEVDVEQYNLTTHQDLNKDEIRHQVQEDVIKETMNSLKYKGVRAGLIGRNNVYDPAQRLTVAQHLVKGVR